ncbi:alcohol dehydrogenase [Arthrobacter sp. PGP41]|uniref:zinc-binding dehydrogenase n=1 Tax=Arthrobacter sp. PGP41 TaxID=2079227 RepID=UPI000CDC02D4|nr:zinc-binding dehydrogenase [Arthrobacter sp. PGP41]AUZ33845.1 alcohol dehydrogenase [Arthrobacter sp. PGP41]
MIKEEPQGPVIPATMKAAVWDGEGARLNVESIPTPEPQKDEALVKIAACGVCHSDLHVMKGEVAFPSPAVLGHEISGTIVAIGEGTFHSERAVGDRVVGAFIMPCTKCDSCSKGRDDLCELFFQENRLHGNLFDGTSRLRRSDNSRLSMYSMAGMAEYAVVPLSALASVPDELPLEEAAVLGCAAFTAFGAVTRSARLEAGESVAIVAVGGVGSSLIQVAKFAGAAPIIAIDISDAKLAAAKSLGADFTINSGTEDAVEAVRRLTGGRGANVAFEALGHPATFAQAISLLSEGGRMVAVGIAAGAQTASVPITPLVRRGQSIVGSFGARTRSDLPLVVDMAKTGGYALDQVVTRKYPLADVQKAFTAMEKGEIHGRAIVCPEQLTPWTPDEGSHQLENLTRANAL